MHYQRTWRAVLPAQQVSMDPSLAERVKGESLELQAGNIACGLAVEARRDAFQLLMRP